LINTRAGRLAVSVVVCAALLVACSKSQPTATPSRSSTAVPSQSSTAADLLPAAIAEVMSSYTTTSNIRAIIVDVNGRPRFEHYYSSTPAESRSIFSVTKSVTSTLVGIAISEGRLHLDERLAQMLPRYAAEMKPSVARVTLRQLLTHTAGFTDTFDLSDDKMLTSPDWVRYILAHQDYAPGSGWHYSDHGAHLLAPILVQATGESVLTYARAKLFDPLGIVTRPSAEPQFDPQAVPPAYEKAQFAWPIDPQGFHMTEALIKLRPRDMATFGQLFLQNGQWNGRQVVPTAWVPQATAAQAGKAFPDFGSSAPGSAFNPTNYGYFWWVEPTTGVPAYYAWGYGGQLIEVVPSLHLVIVVSSYVDATKPAPVVGLDEVQRLVDAIVLIIKTHPTR
jgi:CubicO group peptidase (beta-lactamase class C family)